MSSLILRLNTPQLPVPINYSNQLTAACSSRQCGTGGGSVRMAGVAHYLREFSSMLYWTMLAACTVGPGTVVTCSRCSS